MTTVSAMTIYNIYTSSSFIKWVSHYIALHLAYNTIPTKTKIIINVNGKLLIIKLIIEKSEETSFNGAVPIISSKALVNTTATVTNVNNKRRGSINVIDGHCTNCGHKVKR